MAIGDTQPVDQVDPDKFIVICNSRCGFLSNRHVLEAIARTDGSDDGGSSSFWQMYCENRGTKSKRGDIDQQIAAAEGIRALLMKQFVLCRVTAANRNDVVECGWDGYDGDWIRRRLDRMFTKLRDHHVDLLHGDNSSVWEELFRKMKQGQAERSRHLLRDDDDDDDPKDDVDDDDSGENIDNDGNANDEERNVETEVQVAIQSHVNGNGGEDNRDNDSSGGNQDSGRNKRRRDREIGKNDDDGISAEEEDDDDDDDDERGSPLPRQKVRRLSLERKVSVLSHRVDVIESAYRQKLQREREHFEQQQQQQRKVLDERLQLMEEQQKKQKILVAGVTFVAGIILATSATHFL